MNHEVEIKNMDVINEINQKSVGNQNKIFNEFHQEITSTSLLTPTGLICKLYLDVTCPTSFSPLFMIELNCVQ